MKYSEKIKEAIDKAFNKGWIKGYKDGKYDALHPIIISKKYLTSSQEGKEDKPWRVIAI